MARTDRSRSAVAHLPWQKTLPLVLRLAGRELRGGLSGFRIFIACVALGVAVITGVGALYDALRSGFERQGATILGGDVTLARTHTRASEAERVWLAAQGRLSETVTLRTMARRPDGSDQTVVEIKAADSAYPLTGVLKLKDGTSPAGALSRGVIVSPMLLERLNLRIGDRVRIGTSDLEIAALLESEPDGLADRITYGPRVMLSLAKLEKTGLIQPGALVRWRYATLLNENPEPLDARLTRFRDDLAKAFPEAGFTITDRRDPSPQVTRTIDRLRQFLTLLGLTSLITGGLGVANAVAAFLERRRKVIATFKSIGAGSRMVFAIFLAQVMAMAVIGTAIGLVLGLLLLPLVSSFAGGYLPVDPDFAISPRTAGLAIAYGLLVAVLFALWPLGQAERVNARVLFREDAAAGQTRPRRGVLMLLGLVAAMLVAIVVASSASLKIASIFLASVVAIFALFWGLGALITRWARGMRRPKKPELALALANIGAPGGLTRSVVLSLGLGLSLLTGIALVNAALLAEVEQKLPRSAPAYFVLDVPKRDQEAFRATVMREVPGAEVEDAPMLRGRLMALAGVPVETIKAPQESQWVLSGDRGLTYSDRVPAGSTLVQGRWWDPGYTGEPLVSFEKELAQNLSLKIGDSITVNVLGRNITARIANLREVKWDSLALNFVMVFSPNTLAGAPHALLATISLPRDTPVSEEVRLARVLGQSFPGATPIRLKEAIEAFNTVFQKIMHAVRAAGGVTLLAGALVLAGALATAQRRRMREAVILKTLGATRARILAAHAVEYLLLAAITAAVAIAIGSAGARLAVTRLMDLDFVFSWPAVGWALATASLLILVFGGAATWRILSVGPVPILRSE